MSDPELLCEQLRRRTKGPQRPSLAEPSRSEDLCHRVAGHICSRESEFTVAR
jgi:hypothetical protein